MTLLLWCKVFPFFLFGINGFTLFVVPGTDAVIATLIASTGDAAVAAVARTGRVVVITSNVENFYYFGGALNSKRVGVLFFVINLECPYNFINFPVTYTSF